MDKARRFTCVPGVTVSLLIVNILAIAGIVTGQRAEVCAPKTRAFFAFGDSYADNGNRDKTAAQYRRPYGMTWPGYPTGRASDGHIQTDYLATQVLGVPSPPPYAETHNGSTSIAQGINFAVGGSGVTYAYGLPRVATQVDWFESFVSARNFSTDVLGCSVVFLCVSGNDYQAFRGSDEGFGTFLDLKIYLKTLWDSDSEGPEFTVILMELFSHWHAQFISQSTRFRTVFRSPDTIQEQDFVKYWLIEESAVISMAGPFLELKLWATGQLGIFKNVTVVPCTPICPLDLANLPTEVVSLAEQSLQRLYGLGVRNIMVTTLAPWNCLPVDTVVMNYTSCVPIGKRKLTALIARRHNELLENALVELQSNSSGIKFVLLRQDETLRHIQNQSTSYGFTEPFRPCCAGNCGGVDAGGNPRYSVCAEPEKHVFWDREHPTEMAWKTVVPLYLHDERFTKFASTLQDWVQELS